MAKLAASILLFFCCLTVPVFAESCAELFVKNLVEEQRPGYLTAEDREIIRKIFANPELNANEKALAAFTADLDARLRGVSPEQAEKVRKTFASVKVKIGNRLRGYYLNFGEGYLSVQIPENYMGTILHYGVIRHELEHRLQDLALKEKGIYPTIILPSPVALAHEIYWKEEGAMRAEWAFFSSIPEATRLSLAEEVRRDPNLAEKNRKLILRYLEKSSLPADAYIQAQHDAGRYSLADVYRHSQIKAVVIQDAAQLMFSGMLGVMGLNSVCGAMVDEKGGHPDTKFFTTVCLKLSGVQQKISEKKGSVGSH